MSLVRPLALVVLLVPTTAASQPVASALLRVGDPLPSVPGHSVAFISNTAVNHAGGYAVTTNSEDATTTLSHVWGSFDGVAVPDVIRSEQTIGDYQQNSFESFFGLSMSSVAYSPSCDDLVGGSTGLDGVWVDATIQSIEEDLYPNEADTYWSFGSRPSITSDGTAFWVGGITSTVGGGTERRGLFRGPGATPLLLGGELVPGIAAPLSLTSAVSFDFGISALGTSYIAEVDASGAHVVIDGALLTISGDPVSEGEAISPAIGGLAGEAWQNFDFLAVNEAGDYLITGDTSAATVLDEFYAKNGVIVHREGDLIDGIMPMGTITDADMNEDGDVAVVWNTAGGEVLFVNERVALSVGTDVDLDGDGAVDVGATLQDFTGISAMTISDRVGDEVSVYFTGDVLDPGAGGEEIEAFFCVTVSVGSVSVPAGATTSVALRVVPNPVGALELATFEAPDGDVFARLDVFDATGRRITQLGSGAAVATWDGTDARGRRVAPGVYFVRGRTDRQPVNARIVRQR